MLELRSTPVAGILAVAAGFAVACSDAPPLPEVSAPPPSTDTSVYSGEGLPGPWWQRGSTREDFDRDQRLCRKHSSDAREAAEDDRDDAAYRTFLDCMAELAWLRGTPPRRPIAAAISP